MATSWARWAACSADAYSGCVFLLLIMNPTIAMRLKAMAMMNTTRAVSLTVVDGQ